MAKAKSASEGDTSKKVKLKLESTDAAFTGPIRILGVSSTVHHPATAPLPNVPDRTAVLWLSALEATMQP